MVERPTAESREADAPCAVDELLAWSYARGVAVAVCRPRGRPAGAAEIVFLTATDPAAPASVDVPPPVRAALVQHGAAIVRRLEVTRATLGRELGPPFSNAPHLIDPALVSRAAWVTSVRRRFDPADRSAWASLVAAGLAQGVRRWVAEAVATEVLVSEVTLRPGVRARHLAAVASALGTAPDA